MELEIKEINRRVQTESLFVQELKKEMSRVIVGQEDLLQRILIGLLANGHILLEGVPGLAKTLAVKTLAQAIDASFSRIQFTPDLLPADLTGTLVFNPKDSNFIVRKGPVFANLVLADEINRAPAKVQSALLEAMQERQVTIGDTTHPLPELFLVLATQNPIEQEGTYPLPEAQLDRFFFQINIQYPGFEDEKEIVHKSTSGKSVGLKKVLNAEEILNLQEIVRKVPVADHVVDYAVRLTTASRPQVPQARDFVKNWIAWGAGPRASQALVLGGKAKAVLEGRHAVSVDDVKALAPPVLRHRIIRSFHAEAEGVAVETVIGKLIESVPS